MGCNFKHVKAAATCTEDFSGIGSKFYLFRGEDLTAEPDYSEDAAEYDSDSFTFLEGKGAYQIDFKAQTGQVTSANTPDGGGFTNTFTCRVAKNVATMSYMTRIMNNSKGWGILVPTGKKNQFYVIYDPTFDCTLTTAGDTGTTPDSDHGTTLTIACGPMKYELCTWEGTLTVAEKDEGAA